MFLKTEELASFVAESNASSIPKELLILTKKSILDYVGVSLAACKLEQLTELISNFARESSDKPEASIIGKDFKTSVIMAALVNGTIGHALDFDDSYASAVNIPAHPSAAVIPAILALGEKYHRSGQEILTAYILGFEVESRIGLLFGHDLIPIGWHTTAIIGSIGAAAAASRILGLNTSKTRNALGIAASLSSGLTHNFGTMTKPLHIGNAARNGVTASLLASQGFTSSEDIFDNPISFFSPFNSGKELKVNELNKYPLTTWIMPKAIGFKPYPCCRETHSAIDTALFLRNKHQLDSDRIAQITSCADEALYTILPYHQPKTGLEGKFSIEYCIGTALLHGKVSVLHFKDENVHDLKLQQLINKVKIAPEPSTGPLDLGHRLIVKLEDGREFTHRVDKPKGEPENPMSQDELEIKFKDCTSLVMSPSQAEQCLQMINNLEFLPDIGSLMALCSGHSSI